jgi:2'-5' RNA ligase
MRFPVPAYCLLPTANTQTNKYKMRDPLFFIALLPTEHIQQEVTSFKNICAERFKASHALTSPPHITLIPPFPWPATKLNKLGNTLDNFAAVQKSFEVQLKDFNCFKPRVLFVDVLPNPLLLNLQKALIEHLEESVGLKDERNNRFHAHMTIAHRDLRHWVFSEAWEYFSQQRYTRIFIAQQLSLMEHSRGHWQVYESYDLID